MKLSLPFYIKSKSSCVIEMDFVTPLPKRSGLRSGTIDSTSFFAAYWFPQIAVYDDIDGWHNFKYSGSAEFYNDFGDFDVSITGNIILFNFTNILSSNSETNFSTRWLSSIDRGSLPRLS